VNLLKLILNLRHRMNEDRIPVLRQSDERSSKIKHSKKMKNEGQEHEEDCTFEPALNDEETEDSTAHLKQVIQAQDHTTEVTSQPAQ